MFTMGWLVVLVGVLAVRWADGRYSVFHGPSRRLSVQLRRIPLQSDLFIRPHGNAAYCGQELAPKLPSRKALSGHIGPRRNGLVCSPGPAC
jgi:hypothetical protein